MWVVGFSKVVQRLVLHDLEERILATHSSRILPPLVVHCSGLAGPYVSLFPSWSMRKMTYLSYPNFLSKLGLGGWVISLDLHGSMLPRECPWHVQHFALDLVSRLQSTIVCLSVGRSLSFDSHQ